MTTMNKETTDPTEVDELQVVSNLQNDKEMGTSEKKLPKQDSHKIVIGFVTGINKQNNTRYITCNFTYPGNDPIIWCSRNRSVNVGGWVEAKISESDFEKYFPPNPTAETPRYSFMNWKEVHSPANYTVASSSGLQLKIKNFRIPRGHKSGNPVEDEFLGLVDDAKHIPNGPSVVNLTVRRRPVFKARDGRASCWSVIDAEQTTVKAEKARSGISSSSDSSSSRKSSSEKENKAKKTEKQKEVKKKESVFPTAKPVLSGFEKHIDDRKGKVFAPSSASEKIIKKAEPILKRAVVTSIKSNNNRSKKGKDQKAYLWLLDDHQPSTLMTSGVVIQKNDGTKTKLYPGYFFEGSFQQEGNSKWVCTKHIRKLGKLMETTGYKDQLELQFVTDVVYPISVERLRPETYHGFIGKIIDRYSELPNDCSSGVRINIKLTYIPARGDWCWVVSKIHKSSKHVQLLTEFHQIWHMPGIRDSIGRKCIPEFAKLKNLMDIELDSNNAQKPLDDANWKFAWVIEHNENSTRMIVFPRVDGQSIDEMKRTVTDRNVYKSVQKMEVFKLYKVKLNPNDKIAQMIDCLQVFQADESGNIELKFACSDDITLSKNVAIVDPIGVPAWLGKLMFVNQRRPIKNQDVLLQTKFRLLDDEDLFANGNAARDNGVLFINTGCSVKKWSSKNADETLQNESEVVIYEHNSFKTKLRNLHPNQDIFPMFQAVCSILKNKQIIDEMKLQGIDTDDLMQLQSSIRS